MTDARRSAERRVGWARLWARAKQVVTTDPTGSDGAGLVGDHRDGADTMGAEVVDGGEVESGRLDRHDRGVGLTGRRGGEQVVDVDAALEHDQVAPAGEHAQRAGLPGRPGGEEQDDLHPRRTTVRLGAS